MLEEGGVLRAGVVEVVEEDTGGDVRHGIGPGGVPGVVVRRAAVRLLTPGEDAALVRGDRLRLLVRLLAGVEGAVVRLVELLVVDAVQLQVDALAVGARPQCARAVREPDLQVVVGGLGRPVQLDDAPGEAGAAEGGLDAVEGVRAVVRREVVPQRHLAQRQRFLRLVEDLQRGLGRRGRSGGRLPVPEGELGRVRVRPLPDRIQRRGARRHNGNEKEQPDLGPHPTSGLPAAAGGRHGVPPQDFETSLDRRGSGLDPDLIQL